MRTWLNSTELLPSVRCALEFAMINLLARGRPDGSIPHALSAAMTEAGAARNAVQSHVRMNGLMARGETAAAGTSYL